jgi:Resolvase, N terminal domain
LVVWRLDRLGRSLRYLIETITDLHTRGIGFKSITENIDTTTSGGKLIFHIFGALAEFRGDPADSFLVCLLMRNPGNPRKSALFYSV